MSDRPNISIGKIEGGQNNIASEIHGNQVYNHQASSTLNIQQVLAAIQQSTPEEQRAEIDPIIEGLEQAATTPLPETEEEQQSLKDSIWDYINKLDPYVPYIRKTLAAFTEGALKTIPPPASWVIGGCLEVCKQERNDA